MIIFKCFLSRYDAISFNSAKEFISESTVLIENKKNI